MSTAVESIFQGSDDEEDNMFGDGSAAVQEGPGDDEDEEMDLFGDETKPTASNMDR